MIFFFELRVLVSTRYCSAGRCRGFCIVLNRCTGDVEDFAERAFIERVVLVAFVVGRWSLGRQRVQYSTSYTGPIHIPVQVYGPVQYAQYNLYIVLIIW